MNLLNKTTHGYHKCLLVVIIFGAFLRFYNLGASGTGLFEFNEVAEILVASNNIDNLATAIRALEFAPPFYHFLLHFWMYIGKSEFILRSFSAIVGVLSIPMIYLVGKELFNEKVGLISALILATSPIHVYYSQITRHYALLVVLSLCSVYYFIKILNNANVTKKTWFGFVSATLMIMYTHYYSFLIIIVENILVILSRRERSFYKNWIISQIALVALYLPWIPFMLLSIVRRTDPFVGSQSNPSIIVIPMTFEYFSLGILHTFNSWAFDQIILILGILIYSSLFIVGLLELKKDKSNGIIIFSFLFIPIIISFIYGFQIKTFADRYLLHISFAFYIIIALALNKIRDNRIFAVIITCILLISVGTIYQNQVYFRSIAKNDLPAVSDYINNNSNDNDVILVSEMLAELHIAYYYTGSLEMYGLPEDFDWEHGISKQTEINTWNLNFTIQNIKNFTNGHKRFWYINLKANDVARIVQNLEGNINRNTNDSKHEPLSGGDMVKEYLDENYKLILKNETISDKYKLYLYET